MDSSEREEVHRCSKQAATVPQHARCVVKVLDQTRHVKLKPKKTFKSETLKSHFKKKSSIKKPYAGKYYKTMKRKEDWVGSFLMARAKRSIQVVNRDSYNIPSPDDGTFFSKVIRQVTKTVRKFKNKEGIESWNSAIQRVRQVGEEAKRHNRRRKALKKRLQMMIENTPDDFLDPRKPLAMKKMELEDEDIMMKRKEAMMKKDEFRVPMKLLREGIKLAMSMAGKNVSNFDKKTLKIVSPRFMSLMPDQDETELFNLLSPSLFSLHEEGNEVEKAFSLPRMLKELPNKDQEAWLNFIMEASGVTDAVDKAEKTQRDMREKEMRLPDGTPMYFTKENATKYGGEVEKRKIETFERLDRTYTKDQKEELEQRGYAFMDSKQLSIVYGPNSPFNKSDSLQLFKSLRRMHDDPHHMIESDIRALAEAKKFKLKRMKEIVLSPFLLTWLVLNPAVSQPIILSPLVLSPIVLSPSVLGPIILSPWVFVPLILSPRVLAPLIVNPIIFSPIVLSPLVLHPLILVPGVFNPIVLSPSVLGPLILSPQVFSPLILNPLVLSPLILNPMAASPLVLSPFVLSPIIYSPQFYTALVLSPYALSPLIESKLVASEVILSPSWAS